MGQDTGRWKVESAESSWAVLPLRILTVDGDQGARAHNAIQHGVTVDVDVIVTVQARVALNRAVLTLIGTGLSSSKIW